MDNTSIPFTGILDSERKGGWTLGGNYAPGLALKTNVQYTVIQQGVGWFFTRVAYNGIDLGILTFGPYPDQATAIRQMNNAKVMDGTS